jgi:hypothetical protein
MVAKILTVDRRVVIDSPSFVSSDGSLQLLRISIYNTATPRKIDDVWIFDLRQLILVDRVPRFESTRTRLHGHRPHAMGARYLGSATGSLKVPRRGHGGVLLAIRPFDDSPWGSER